MDKNQNHVIKRFDDFIKPQADKRVFRALILRNHMEVFLVSDPTTDKSAAALNVSVGSMSGPKEVYGLVHLCEHMLFLGTRKYPNENDFRKYLSEHGGSSSAVTGLDHTNYHFDVIPEKLDQALDRFSQFFIAPLFTESATDREVNAVNSEHEKNIPSDVWRENQLDRHLADPNHAYNHFGTGNKLTLDTQPKEKNINVRDELLKFHDKWYSSNIMCLAVLGKETLDQLEAMVVELFSKVANKSVKSPQWEEHPFKDEHFGTYVYMRPIKDDRSLRMVFPCEGLQKHYKSQPSNFTAHLMGHKGPGSILSTLKARGWSNKLVAGSERAPRGTGFFGVTVDLTEEGLDHVDDIIELIFQYLNMLKSIKPQKWVQDENNDILDLTNRFQDKKRSIDFICGMVANLHEYIEDVLICENPSTEWEPEIIEELWSNFVPDKIRVVVVSKKFGKELDQVEPWYGTKYQVRKIPQETLNKWNQAGLSTDLKMPEKNAFIPTDFHIYPPDKKTTKHPIIIENTAFIRVWFKQDDMFLLPKANVRFDFVSPLAYRDPLSCNQTHMLVRLFRDALDEYAYAASLAGLEWTLINTKYGFTLCISGFNHKQHILLSKIMEKLTNFKIDPKRFEICKEKYIRNLRNFAAEPPYKHADYYLAVLLDEHSLTIQERLAVTHQLTVDKLEAFIPQILSKMHIECLAHGNVNKEKALQLVRIVEDSLLSSLNMSPLPPEQLSLNRSMKLEDGCNYMYEVQNDVHKDSSIEVYYQCGLRSDENNMKLELFARIIKEPCFDTLRTKEQLGYEVYSGIGCSNGVQGLEISVQSDRHPLYLDERIEKFLQSMLTHITEMSEETFMRHRKALAFEKLKKPTKLSTQTRIYWSEIKSQQYHFDRANIEVADLKSLTKNDLIEFHKGFLQDNADFRKKLSVHVVSMAEGGAGRTSEEKMSNEIVSGDKRMIEHGRRKPRAIKDNGPSSIC